MNEPDQGSIRPSNYPLPNRGRPHMKQALSDLKSHVGGAIGAVERDRTTAYIQKNGAKWLESQFLILCEGGLDNGSGLSLADRLMAYFPVDRIPVVTKALFVPLKRYSVQVLPRSRLFSRFWISAAAA